MIAVIGMDWIKDSLQVILDIILSVWGKFSDFVLMLWDMVYGLICDFFGYIGEYISDIANGLYNWLIEWLMPWIVEKIGSFEYTYSVLQGVCDVLIWTNYFLPLRELSGFFVWFLPFAFMLYLICLTVKIVIAIIP